MVLTKFNFPKKVVRPLAVLIILTMIALSFPGMLLAADSESTGSVNYDYYHNAGAAIQSMVKACGYAPGGFTLAYYQAHASIFTPEEKVYYDAAFGLSK